jgi:hypothetical protein
MTMWADQASKADCHDRNSVSVSPAECCIFHKQKAFDESSSSDESEEECEHHPHKHPERDKPEDPARQPEVT